jgi:hypothetical protein
MRDSKRPLRPSDGRLKANRDFARFMMRAVHIPSVQRKKGEFRVEDDEPVPAVASLPIARPTSALYGRYTDRQLALVLASRLTTRAAEINTTEAAFDGEIAAELYWRLLSAR